MLLTAGTVQDDTLGDRTLLNARVLPADTLCADGAGV